MKADRAASSRDALSKPLNATSESGLTLPLTANVSLLFGAEDTATKTFDMFSAGGIVFSHSICL